MIWFEGKIIHPEVSPAPMPHSDLPERLKADFLEARSILRTSSRGAAGLLRYVLEVFEPTGTSINGRIGNLVKNSLHVNVQQALDTVRVIGNNAVPP